MPIKVKNLCLKCWTLITEEGGCKKKTHPRISLSLFMNKLLSSLKEKQKTLKRLIGQVGESAYTLWTKENGASQYKLPTGGSLENVDIIEQLIEILSKKPLAKHVQFIKKHRMELFSFLNLHDSKGKEVSLGKHVRRDDWLLTFANNLKSGDEEEKVNVSEAEIRVLNKLAEELGKAKQLGATLSESRNQETDQIEEIKAASNKIVAECLIPDSEELDSKYLLMYTGKLFNKRMVIMTDISCKKAVAFLLTASPNAEASVVQVKHKLYFTGGKKNKNPNEECSLFDFTLNSARVRPFASMNKRREEHALVSIKQILYVLGGITEPRGPATSSCEKCSKDFKKWLLIPNLPINIAKPSAFSFSNRFLYTIGSVEIKHANRYKYFIFRLEVTDEEAGWNEILNFQKDYLRGIEFYAIPYSISGIYIFDKRHEDCNKFDVINNCLTEYKTLSLGYWYGPSSKILYNGNYATRVYFEHELWMHFYFIQQGIKLGKRIPLIIHRT